MPRSKLVDTKCLSMPQIVVVYAVVGIFIALVVSVILCTEAFVLELLWNGVMSQLFRLPNITFLESISIMGLFTFSYLAARTWL